MSIIKYFKRIRYIDFIIARKATGDLHTFAKKNNLSKRALTNVMRDMKDLGFPIKYDRNRQTYYYDEDGEMVKCLFVKNLQALTRDEIGKIEDVDNMCFSKVEIFEICKYE